MFHSFARCHADAITFNGSNFFLAILVQDFHARVGSTQAEDSIAVPQPTIPVGPLSLVRELSSSPLSSAPSLLSSPGFLPSSPAYIKTEDDGDGMAAGRTKGASVASTARSARSSISRRQPGIDECADAEWVDILNIPDTDPDVQITATTRA